MSVFAPWQQRVYEHAASALDAGRLGHGLLFCGPARLGKRAVAERLANRLLCTSRTPDGEPCGSCRSCRLFALRSQTDPVELRPDGSLAHPGGHTGHPDFLQISYGINDKARPPRSRTEIVIDQMRRLSEQMALTAQYGDAKIAIIEPADAINHAGANALLKTLEEPVPGRYLWLVSANPARLSATIRSRCQKLEFRLPARDEALAWLQRQGHAESAAAEALDAARGHPGLADEWLQGEGLAVRRQVAGDLAKLAAGDIAVVETAQRWVADSDADLRLRFAADLALSAAADGLTDPMRTRSLAAWFDRANRARELLRSTVRADLVVVELLMAWRAGEARRAAGKQRG
ncbi:DNA polymerase III subunit delta' [Lysobacter concretionis Ko07 = DSM 16239]|uniref:DNA-directed DNA polymerase n=1 Tax=Lysobacter concretionis Ko07 = DSM 16239 TaxID=1122185 RepID=A0A0A0EN88_9GAMM|nr:MULTISPECIES: DNA polymerase III subunit delta' [Lysobacter]KGM52421.1 DNA polymerase III subunit delta' [Lysobacter concretionis Ko07 = DSM 16239]QOD91834.1 DNA polymerase III subunit delta' [Lysobacter sp. CW239]